MADDEWKDLFNGVDLAGWAVTGNADGWIVKDGMIVCLAEQGGYLYTEDQYEDFELELQYRHDPDANSGIFFRWSDLSDPVHTGLEIQILDTHGHEPMQRHSCGALYDLVAPEVDMARPAGEWNEANLVCKGSFVQYALNGRQIVSVDIDQWSEAGRNPDDTENKFKYAWRDMSRLGHIGLQDHGGQVWFRDIRLRSL